MADISAEPSMEEILSSIKRIIAEEGDGVPPRPRRAPRVVPPPAPVHDPLGYGDDDAVLELSEPMPERAAPPPQPVSQPAPPPPVMAERAPPPAAAAVPAQPRAAEPIVSQQTAAASRGSLDALTRLVVKPEPGSDGSLEGLVRDMLRPMLREWLDARLPPMVEAMVAREIERITGARR